MERILRAMDKASPAGGQRRRPPPIMVPQRPQLRVDDRDDDLEPEQGQTRIAAPSPAQAAKGRLVAAAGGIGAASFLVLRTQVLQACRKHGWRVIGVTSVHSGSGKTFVCANLGIAMAHEMNQSVLLADFDIRSPHLGTLFGQTLVYGVADCVTKGHPVDRLLFSPGIPRLAVLSGSIQREDASELLASQGAQKLLRELAARPEHPLVLCDLAPLSMADDVLVCLPNLDALILVVEARRTEPAELQQGLELVKHVPLAAVVLNKVRQPRGREDHFDLAYR